MISLRRQELAASEITSSVYDSPNWSHKQADTNGMTRVLKWVDDLLDFSK